MIVQKTIADHIYEVLKEEILNLKIEPGQKLSEKGIAERFDVSCAPARNAISKLQGEGLVIVRPQVGTLVSSISYQKAADLFTIRLLLEPFAAKKAVRRIPQEELEVLKKEHENLCQMEKEGNITHEIINSFDKHLHSLLLKWSGNIEITNILSNFSNETRRIRLSTTDVVDIETPNRQELDNLFDAIMTRSGKKAERAMVIHLTSVKKSVLRALSKKYF